MTTPKTEKRRARRQQNARDKTTTAPDPPTPNKGPQTMTTAPGPHNPNKGPQTMTTPPAPATPENLPFALVVEVSTKAANPATGRPGATIFSIQNPDGSYWTNRRGRRRAWTSKRNAYIARYTETNAVRAAKGLSRLPLGEFPSDESGRPFPTGPIPPPARPAPPAPPAPPAVPASDRFATPRNQRSGYEELTAVEMWDTVDRNPPTAQPRPEAPNRNPVPLDVDNPDGERVGKLVAAAIAIDPRIARYVMDVVSSMIRTA